MKKEIGEKIFVFQIIGSEFVALNCLYQEGSPCLRQPVC